MPQQTPPKAPNPNKLYAGGIKTYLQYEPQLLAAEQSARNQYDPLRIQQQLALQQQYGPTQYAQQIQALQQLDPTGTALRDQLGKQVSSDLALGGKLSPEMETQLESEIRGAQSARGNVLGSAPAAAEELFKGQAAANLYQQRLTNAGNFLSSPTPEQQLVTVSPVTADRSSAYVDPNAGFQGQQFGLQNYQNQLAQYQLSGGGRNPWAGALGGAASGAAAGTAVMPGYGTAIGAIAGGIGGYFSDSRLKCNIIKVGESKSGIPIFEFSYIADPQKRYRGTTAQALLDHGRSDAVGQFGQYYIVDYKKLDVKLVDITCRAKIRMLAA